MNRGITTSHAQEHSVLRTLCFCTITDATYEFPDMMAEHVEELKENLARPTEKIVARNISDATLVIPYRILSRVEILEGARGRDGEDCTNVIWRREV